ncbi:uncharacterized protein LOC120277791 [Dioscorea cayenensis subsp. rotundata]|uniref:Uncharacterized protein LOC120277791 n=1 Tax=Dioscorea cayennensis subsp. rotundata TaxID=55577 RepID=A0AB40CKG1_DIOCR|nr:uncharacterized protein LOC120277791 [Dioscorea cayenensis subsp. rotundata]
MAENTLMKEIQAKVETLFTLMDNNEQRFKSIEQALTTLPFIQQSLQGLSQMIETFQTLKPQGESSTLQSVPDDSPHDLAQTSLDTYSVRNIKIDFPRFGGTDAWQWIFQAEQFFGYYAVPDKHRLKIASVHFDGPVVPWFQRLQKSGKLTSWEVLTTALEKNYGPSAFDCPRYSLFRLTQDGTMAQFFDQFTALDNRVQGVPDDILLDSFVSGLTKELQAEIIPWHPEDLDQAISLARLFEEKLQLGRKQSYSTNMFIPDTKLKPISVTAPVGNTSTIVSSGQKLLGMANSTTGNVTHRPPTTFRRMGFQEMQIRKSKGLCFNCDEKYSPTHKCPNKRLLLLQWDDDDNTIYDSEFFIDPHPPDEVQELSTKNNTKMSLNAMSSSTVSGTMRFTGNLGGQQVNILLDGGSDDTFIQPRVVKFLKLDILPTTPLRVLVGNGQTLNVEGQIPELTIDVQGYTLLVLAFVLAIEGADLILGTSWLAKLGPHVVDYDKKVIQFYHNNQFMILKGEKSSKPVFASVNQLSRLCCTRAVSACYSLQIIQDSNSSLPLQTTDTDLFTEIQNSLPLETPPELVALLLKFQMVFSNPMTLPPSRNCNHQIPLIPGSAPVKVKPYRYPHSQKAEIERMVTEMLSEGLIEHNTNELYGAVYFSKLDLRSGYHQILVHPEDKFKTAFRTHQHYQWLVMPFGLSNAPATFQNLMHQVFHFALRKYVLVFFDDILIYSTDWDLHLQHLESVLSTLMHHQLFAKLSKCSFGRFQMEYLGHIVSNKGVEMDPSKIAAIVQWPIPQTLKQVRAFLGLSGYYRKFIKQYASLAKPLTDLLKKDSFCWSETTQQAFNILKQDMISAPILALPVSPNLLYLELMLRGWLLGQS